MSITSRPDPSHEIVGCPPARPGPLHRAARAETDGWRSLARWVRRRPDVEPGGTPFAYRGPEVAPLVVMTLLSALELVGLDVILARTPVWTWLRVLLFLVGVWGVLFVLGMLAGVTVHPHVVGRSGLRVRHGPGLDVLVPWNAVGRARPVRRTRDGRSVQLDGGALHVAVSKQTTVEITLARPTPVWIPREGTVRITSLTLYADDAAGLVRAIGSARERARG